MIIMEDIISNWTIIANKQLKGKTIKRLRYMTDNEKENFMFYKRSVVIEFTDGTSVVPQSDDEGNDAGALWIFKDGKESIIPTIY